MKLSNQQFYVLLAIAGVAAYYVVHEGVKVASEAANAVNPTNNNNVINQGFNSVYGAITGSTGTLGTDIAKAQNSVSQWLKNHNL